MVSRALTLALFVLLVVGFPVAVVAQATADPTALIPQGELDAIVGSVRNGYAAFGALGAIGGFLAVAVRVARLVPGFNAVWGKWPRWVQFLIPVVLSFASAGLLAGLGGGGVAGIIIAGVASAAGAVFTHQGAKALLPEGIASPAAPDPGMGLSRAQQSLKVPIGKVR